MTVVVYGRADCPPCHTLKYLLERKNITYKYIEGGAKIFPTIEIDGHRIEGSNWPAINLALAS